MSEATTARRAVPVKWIALAVVLVLVAAVAVTLSLRKGPVVPDAQAAQAIDVGEGYVGTEYAFGIVPLGVPAGRRAEVEKVTVGGLRPQDSVRVIAVAASTSPKPPRALVGSPEQVDPERFEPVDVAGLEVEADDDRVEDHYLVVVIKPGRLGVVRTTRIDVAFRSGDRTVTRGYPYRFGVDVVNARGSDPRARSRR